MWSFVLTDNAFAPVGEIINAENRQVITPVNKLDTLQLSVRMDNPLAAQLATCEGYIKAYRDSLLHYFGPIVSAEETGDANGASVAVNSVSAGWFLTKRYVDTAELGPSSEFIWPFATDRAQIMAELINGVNANDSLAVNGNFGNVSAATAITYNPLGSKKVYEVLTELAVGLDGFDWRILPIEGIAGNSESRIGLFTASPVIGVERPDAVFEWGGGRSNIVGYKRTVSRDTQANLIFVTDDSGSQVVASAFDYDSSLNWRTLEDLLQPESADPFLQQPLADEHLRVRKEPRVTIEFEPHVDPLRSGRLPYYGTDYEVGDRIRARATYGGTTRFDVFLRVWAATFTIDSNGVEKVILTLSEE